MHLSLLQGGKGVDPSSEKESSFSLGLREQYRDGYVEIVWLDGSSTSPFLQFPVDNNELGFHFCSVLKRVLENSLDEGLLVFRIVEILDWMVLRKKEFLSLGEDKSFFYKHSERLVETLISDVASEPFLDVVNAYSEFHENDETENSFDL